MQQGKLNAPQILRARKVTFVLSILLLEGPCSLRCVTKEMYAPEIRAHYGTDGNLRGVFFVIKDPTAEMRQMQQGKLNAPQILRARKVSPPISPPCIHPSWLST